jgi:hypothetical protein
MCWFGRRFIRRSCINCSGYLGSNNVEMVALLDKRGRKRSCRGSFRVKLRSLPGGVYGYANKYREDNRCCVQIVTARLAQ